MMDSLSAWAKVMLRLPGRRYWREPLTWTRSRPASELCLETVAQGSEAEAFGGHFLGGDFAGLAEADDAGDVESAGTETALMSPAVHLLGERDAGWAATDPESADAFGPVDFVSGEGQQVDGAAGDVDGEFAHGLGRVGVKEDAVFAAERADFADGLQGANFIVGRHDGDEERPGVFDGAAEIVEADAAFGIDREDGDAAALLRQPCTGIEDGFVLGGLGDDVDGTPRIGSASGFNSALDGEVVALGGAGGEDDFFGRSAEEAGDLSASGFDGLFGGPAKGVAAAGGVAVDVGQERQHGLKHARIDARGGLVIHVDGEVHGR